MKIKERLQNEILDIFDRNDITNNNKVEFIEEIIEKHVFLYETLKEKYKNLDYFDYLSINFDFNSK